jgi:hypothetical protein
MKIAVLLCGHIRTWEKCKETLSKAFPSVHKIDFFVHSYTKQYGYHPFIAEKTGVDDITNSQLLGEIDTLFDSNTRRLVLEKEMETVSDIEDYPVNFDIYSQIRKVRLCNEMRKEYEREHGIKYDLVVKTRMDLLYTSSIVPTAVIQGCVYFPICIETLEPSDVCYMGTGEDMDILIEKLSRKYTPKIINPHTWLKMCLEGINIVKVPSNCSVLRLTL